MAVCPVQLFSLLVLMLLTLGASALPQPEAPRPEHPRPDFQRGNWLNLNGRWQFEIDEAGDGEQRGLTSGHDLAREIVVPFCPESRLSGIGNTDFMTHVWYRRMFEVPAAMRGERLLLHFGAVDWHARVWLNGQFVGEHRGGYAPFAFEITGLVRPGGNELVVGVRDDTRSGTQATGKQCHQLESHGCVYTRTTGIWQTVWLEAVGETYLREFVLTPDLDAGRLRFQGWIEGPGKGASVRLRAAAEGKPMGEAAFPAAWRSTSGALQLKRVTPWRPGKPFLYDLTVEVLRSGKVVDAVQTYFGMRKITIEGNRFLINDQPIFQRLVLDQGFYPEGIYTAPSDDALKRDIELAMAAGFNGARLHQKVFEPRLLYWADKLGYIVWGEYPSWGLNFGNAEAMGYAVEEWRQVVRRDRNHPSVVGWCPLNETGGGQAAAALQASLAATQTMDPTRPFLDTSGYVHLYPDTDVYDCHDYEQDPAAFAARYAGFSLTGTDPWNNFLDDPRSRYRGQPFFVSEYGGIRLKTDRDTGDGWGYGETDLKGYLERYKCLTDVLLDNPNMFGFCYTQLTDIEQEQNGIYFYDRQQKYDPALVRATNARPAAYETQPARIRHITWTTLVPTAKDAPQDWRYTTAEPGRGWYEPDHDDAAWQQGKGGFGVEGTLGAVVGTEWAGVGDIWLRRTFRLATTDFPFMALDIHHDEDAEVYVNGHRVASFTGFTTNYMIYEATEALRNALRVGGNTLAVHCRQTEGGQFIDVGIRAGSEKKGNR